MKTVKDSMIYMLRFLKGTTLFYVIASILRGSYSFLENIFTGQLYALVTSIGNESFPIKNIVVAVALLLFLLLSTYIGEILYLRSIASADKNVRISLNEQLVRMPLSVWYKRHFADWLTILGKDTDQATATYKTDLQFLLQLIIQIVAGSIFLFSQNIWMGVCALLIGLLYFGIGVLRKVSMRTATSGQLKHTGNAVSQISNLVEGGLVTRFYKVGGVVTGKIKESIEESYQHGLKAAKINVLQGALGQIGYMLAYAGTIVFGLFLVAKGLIKLPALLAIWPTSVGVAWSLQRIGFFVTSYQTTAAAVVRLKEIEDLPQEREGSLATVTPQTPCISIENLSFSYTEGTPVLQGVSLTIHAGEKIAFVGESGSGKTTLLKLLMNFYPDYQGNIMVYGEEIQGYTLGALRSCFSYVPQTVHLFGDTLEENIKMVRPLASEQELIDTSKASYTYEFIEELEQGMKTIVGEDGFQLSGGQTQRIGINRAFLHNAPIYIFDEISAGLDDDSEDKINRAIQELGVDKTVLLITHRLSSARFADRIVVMNEGVIEEIGTHETLLQKDGLYKKLCQN